MRYEVIDEVLFIDLNTSCIKLFCLCLTGLGAESVDLGILNVICYYEMFKHDAYLRNSIVLVFLHLHVLSVNLILNSDSVALAWTHYTVFSDDLTSLETHYVIIICLLC